MSHYGVRIYCPICKVGMRFRVDDDVSMLVLRCPNCNRKVGIIEPTIKLDLICLGMSPSLDDFEALRYLTQQKQYQASLERDNAQKSNQT